MKNRESRNSQGCVSRFFCSIGRFFKNIGVGFVHFFVNLGKRVKKNTVAFVQRFKDASTGTKLSHLIMGSGNMAHKQIAKGLLFFMIEAAFILFMATSPVVNETPFGWKALGNLITLGTNEGDIFTQTDNSMLMLLFGVVTIGVILLFIMV